MGKEVVVTGPRYRADVYGLLALAFHGPPDEKHISWLRRCADGAKEAGSQDRARAFANLARLAQETDQETLRQDFDDMFGVPGPKYVTPYESVYLDEPIEANGKVKARTCGPSMVAVSAFYQQIGLDVVRGYPELRDYIGLELACMEYLCLKETEYSEAGDGSSVEKSRAFQSSFLKKHLLRWFPELEADIRKKSETDFYRELAAQALLWLGEEKETLCPDV